MLLLLWRSWLVVCLLHLILIVESLSGRHVRDAAILEWLDVAAHVLLSPREDCKQPEKRPLKKKQEDRQENGNENACYRSLG
ncbi:hypothetical protein KTH_10630 [Thermosporothrix hazakensis]|nr:hypothetical protein KTH_10630 [Thermosporothrix hazakensis]